MGRRGPIPGAPNAGGPQSDHEPQRPSRRKRPATAALTVVQSRDIDLDHPASLGKVGCATWDEIVDSIPGRHDHLDLPTLTRFCELVEERDRYRVALENLGPLLSEPMVSPSGAVVGERIVPNPAEQMLRRIDKALDVLSAVLALSPGSRARMGLTVSQAQLTAERFIATMRKDAR